MPCATARVRRAANDRETRPTRTALVLTAIARLCSIELDVMPRGRALPTHGGARRAPGQAASDGPVRGLGVLPCHCAHLPSSRVAGSEVARRAPPRRDEEGVAWHEPGCRYRSASSMGCAPERCPPSRPPAGTPWHDLPDVGGRDQRHLRRRDRSHLHAFAFSDGTHNGLRTPCDPDDDDLDETTENATNSTRWRTDPAVSAAQRVDR
jgi:hypothetical protein